MAKVGDKVVAIFQTRKAEVTVTGTIASFWNGGVEVTFDHPVEYAPGLEPRDGAWYRADQRWMVRSA
jgi:hypothetical protein